MKRFVKSAAFAIAAFAAGALFADKQTVDGVEWTYFTDSPYAEICNGNHPAIPQDSSGPIIVPTALGTCIVTTIGMYSFFECGDVTQVTMPDCVELIGYRAFSGCYGMESVTLSGGLRDIGEYAFYGCSGLKAVEIPPSVRTIGANAFDGCSSLVSVRMPKIDVDFDSVFKGCPKSLRITYWGECATEFDDLIYSVDEGETLTVSVYGGNDARPSRVAVRLQCQTAAAADLDLEKGKIDGEMPKGGLKFPLTLTWDAGDKAPKTITIPVKEDKAVEDHETFYLQLAEPVGMVLGKKEFAQVTIADKNDKQLKPTVSPYKPKKGESVATNEVTVGVSPSDLGFAAGSGAYTAGTKLTMVAEARPGCTFVGWERGGSIESDKPKYQIVVSNDVTYTAKFAAVDYMCGLADPADGGKVTGSGYCPAGKKVTLKATASKGFAFLGWRRVDDGGRGATALPDDDDGRAGSPLPAADDDFVATTASLVIDRTAKPAKDSKTSTTISNLTESSTFYAVFTGDPLVSAIPVLDDGVVSNEAGKVTGVGRYAPGKKVTLKATANKGFAFSGFFDAEGNLLDETRSASYSFEMPSNDVPLTARFVTVDEDQASIKLSVAGEELSREPAFTPAKTNFCGVAMNWSLAADALSATTIKVAGLPSGLKFTAKDILKKGSKTEVDIPANTIYGAPTAASKTDKDGNPVPSTVKVTVTTAGKSSATYEIDLTVNPLPDWAVGTFDGATYAGDSGEASGLVQAFTVAANGKISGKILEGGNTWTLSAGEFSRVERVEHVEDGVVFHATVIAKAGKEVATNEIAVAAVDGIGVLTGTFELSNSQTLELTSYQNLWKRSDTKADMPVIKKDIVKTLELGDPNDPNNTLKLTFKKDGAVAFAGKVGGASVSGSSQLVNDGEGWKVTLYAPQKGTFAGFCKTLAVALTLDAQNIVTEVAIGGGDAPAGSGSWFTGEFNGYGDAQFPIAGGGTEFLNGLFTINVASDLSFTGTFTGTDGTNATFSGTFAKDGSSYVATGVSITVKGKTMSMGLMCDPGPYAGSDEGFGEISGGSEDVQDEPCIALNCAWQNIWKRSDLAAEWKPAFASGTEKTINLADSFLDGLSDGDSLTYAFGANGAVSITGKIYGESVNATATLDLEGLDGSSGTMHCNFYFLANGHLYQQQFTFPRQATVTAADITLDSFVRID